jgi:phosphoserine phosphatase
MAARRIPVALCYDFDGTLAPGNMQERSFLPSLGIDKEVFWEDARRLSREQDCDAILSYMRLMLERATAANAPIRRKDFLGLGAKLRFFPGVEAWFPRINAYAKAKGLALEHFVISSGLREMIEGSKIYGEFAKVYASGYMYDANGVAVWPALAVNYTTKTQFLFRINKGTRDVYDDSVINAFVPKESRPMPFSHIAYVGDGYTDIPCFRLVKQEGGCAIAVYPKGDAEAKARAEAMVGAGGRVNAFVSADYSEGSALERCVRAFLDRVEASARIGPLS